jgi:hypothetical protein
MSQKLARVSDSKILGLYVTHPFLSLSIVEKVARQATTKNIGIASTHASGPYVFQNPPWFSVSITKTVIDLAVSCVPLIVLIIQHGVVKNSPPLAKNKVSWKTMSSDEDDNDDEQAGEENDDEEIHCGACISYRRQRDAKEEERKEAEKERDKEKELREAREKELKTTQTKNNNLEKKNQEYLNALSEVVEKMFYCEKDEGCYSVMRKKGNRMKTTVSDVRPNIRTNAKRSHLSFFFEPTCNLLQIRGIRTSPRVLTVTLTLLQKLCSITTSSSTARA